MCVIVMHSIVPINGIVELGDVHDYDAQRCSNQWHRGAQ